MLERALKWYESTWWAPWVLGVSFLGLGALLSLPGTVARAEEGKDSRCPRGCHDAGAEATKRMVARRIWPASDGLGSLEEKLRAACMGAADAGTGAGVRPLTAECHFLMGEALRDAPDVREARAEWERRRAAGDGGQP